MPLSAQLAGAPAVIATVVLLCACAPPAPTPDAAAPAPPTGDDALAFLNDVERQYTVLGEESSRINWVNATYINFDTNWLAANIDARTTELRVRYAKEAVRFDDAVVPPDARRKLDLLKLNLTLPAPDTDGARARRHHDEARERLRDGQDRIRRPHGAAKRNRESHAHAARSRQARRGLDEVA